MKSVFCNSVRPIVVSIYAHFPQEDWKKVRMLHIPSLDMYKNEILREKDSLLNHGH